jgi:hypothetical protein
MTTLADAVFSTTERLTVEAIRASAKLARIELVKLVLAIVAH